jgi:hypothetical protein
MKVTDKLVSRLGDGLLRLGWYVAGHDRPGLRAALEAALADVPDPYEATSALVNADRRIRELEARVLELEQSLEAERVEGLER